MDEVEFANKLREFRPRLHRYCARMTGSAVDGEDVLQDSIVKALHARVEGTAVENLEAWLLRIVHNTSLDFLRRRSRDKVVFLDDVPEGTATVEIDTVAVGFQTFLQLPELQRCAVILKDVLGHSVEEIAAITDCSAAAAKSALQRGRASLRQLAQQPSDTRLPLMTDGARQKMAAYVRFFQEGDFDAIRAMLAEDVKLDLVNRLTLEGRKSIGTYFTRYAEEKKWRYAFGAVEGIPAMLVFDSLTTMERPAYFVMLGWRGEQIATIRDYLFAPYVIEAVDWARLA